MADEGQRVLVIEDYADAAEALAELLQLWGHDVRVANEAERGLALALVWQPDVVLLDIGLPGVDGYEVARRLRALRRAELRIIATSGFARFAEQARALDAGCDTFLVKPFDLDVLRDDLDQRSAQRRTARRS